MTTQRQEPTLQPDRSLTCPCGAEMERVSSEGFMDDTATSTRYTCEQGHRWAHLVYAAWPEASGWNYLGQTDVD